MLQKIPALFKKNIVKVFIGSSASTLVKILTGIILSKIIAEKLGPEGLGLIGQLTSFVSIALLLATGGYQNGIVAYTAINKENGKLAAFTNPSLKLTLIISFFCGLLLFLFASKFSQLLFKSDLYNFIFYFFGFTIIFSSLNAFINSFLNGISDFKNLSILNIVNSIFSLGVSVALIYWLDIKGALLAVVLSQTLTSLATFRMILKYKQFFRVVLKTAISKELILKLVPYIKMTICSMVLLPIGQIIIRNLIIHTQGGVQMGIWEALNRISGIYMTVIINIMLVYYLPRLSVMEKQEDIIKEFKKGSVFFGAMLLVMGLVIYICRNHIISLFLTPSFYPVGDLILPQLASDFFKVLYYILAYFAIAKSLTRYYIITEVIFFAIYISFAYFFIPFLGIKGAVYANAIMNFIAFITHILFIGRLYFGKKYNITSFLFDKK